jgi:hypothetical protein
MRRLPPLEQTGSREDEWSVTAWLESLQLHQCVAAALCPDGAVGHFDQIRRLDAAQIRSKLSSSKMLHELGRRVEEAVTLLQKQAAPTARALNDKFTTDTARELSFGSLDVFCKQAFLTLCRAGCAWRRVHLCNTGSSLLGRRWRS